MCAQTRPRFIPSSERVFGGMKFEPMLTPREKSPLPENFPRGGSNPRRYGQRAQTLPTSYSGPLQCVYFDVFIALSKWPGHNCANEVQHIGAYRVQHMYTLMHKCTHRHTYTHTRTHACTHARAHTHTHTHTCTHTHVHTYTHIHTHTHTHAH